MASKCCSFFRSGRRRSCRSRSRLLVVTAIIMFVIPNTYTAKATIVPSGEKQSSLTAMLGQLGSIAGLNETDLGIRDPGDLFIGHAAQPNDPGPANRQVRPAQGLQSLTVSGCPQEAECPQLHRLGERRVDIDRVEDRDPNRAAALANATWMSCTRLNSQLAISDAGQRRVFYEEKVNAEREALALAEVAVKAGTREDRPVAARCAGTRHHPRCG